MSDRSRIEWTDATWNPVTGCTKVSPGCDHCYAETIAERFRNVPGHYYEAGFDLQLRFDKLDQPLRWKKPRRVFVNSMSDLFHAHIPDEYIAKVLAVMALTPQHTFQVLTKRPGRMRSLLSLDSFRNLITRLWRDGSDWQPIFDSESEFPGWPLPNVCLGVSAEDQRWADGESGRGARPMHPDWVRSIRDQCQAAGVAFHFKQWGEWQDGSARPAQSGPNHIIVPDGRHELAWMHQQPAAHVTDLARDRLIGNVKGRAVFISRVGKQAAGRELDGRTWNEYPEAATGERADA